MFTFSIIVAAIECVLTLFFGWIKFQFEPLTMLTLIMVSLPCFVLSIVCLVSSIVTFKRTTVRWKGIAAIAISAQNLIYIFLLICLMIFVFSQGGRMPHEVFM